MERPILYKKDMVLAKLAGQKTQTRRVIKKQPTSKKMVFGETAIIGDRLQAFFETPPESANLMIFSVNCTYGKPGDILYGRETFWQVGKWEQSYPEDEYPFWNIRTDVPIVYDATDKPRVIGKNDWNIDPDTHPNGQGKLIPYRGHDFWRKKQAIFMPKKFSRIWDRIINIRVERVQDISEEDVYAEGIPRTVSDPIDEYKKLWDSINKSRGFEWASNPWVWVLETENIKIGLK